MKSCSNCKYKDGCGGACPAERCAGYEPPKIHAEKVAAKKAYQEAKKTYIEDQTAENWHKFCEAKRNCMLLGVII